MSYPEESGQQRWYGDQRAYEPATEQQSYAEPRRPEQPYADQPYAERPYGEQPEPRRPEQPYGERSASGQFYTEPRYRDTGNEMRLPEPRPSESRPPELARSGERTGTGGWVGSGPGPVAQQVDSPVTTGQRHQAERIPLMTAHPRHPDPPTASGHGSAELPMYETPPAPGDSWGAAPTSRMPTVPPVQPSRPAGAPVTNHPGYPSEPAAPRRGASEPVTEGDGVYRARRPGVGIALAIVAGLLALPALTLLWESMTAEPTPASGVVAGTLMLLGLPMFAAGMYELITGAGRAVERQGLRVLLRPPLSYLPIGLVLLLGAALAAT